MLCTLAEEVVEDQTDDWEDEYDDTPEDLVWDGAVGLEDLHYGMN